MIRKLFFLILTLCLNFCFLYGSLNFGSKESAIKVLDGATLNLEYDLPANEGTVKQEQAGFITGEEIDFVEGIFTH